MPAARYMTRRREEHIQARRAEQEPRAAQSEEVTRAWARSAAADRQVRSKNIADEQGETIRVMVDELERTGTTKLSTPAGDVEARITRFRWGDDVIEVTQSSEGEQRGWSCGRLARSPAHARATVLPPASPRARQPGPRLIVRDHVLENLIC